jgi:hypothetical protein
MLAGSLHPAFHASPHYHIPDVIKQGTLDLHACEGLSWEGDANNEVPNGLSGDNSFNFFDMGLPNMKNSQHAVGTNLAKHSLGQSPISVVTPPVKATGGTNTAPACTLNGSSRVTSSKVLTQERPALTV